MKTSYEVDRKPYDALKIFLWPNLLEKYMTEEDIAKLRAMIPHALTFIVLGDEPCDFRLYIGCESGIEHFDFTKKYKPINLPLSIAGQNCTMHIGHNLHKPFRMSYQIGKFDKMLPNGSPFGSDDKFFEAYGSAVTYTTCLRGINLMLYKYSYGRKTETLSRQFVEWLRKNK